MQTEAARLEWAPLINADGHKCEDAQRLQRILNIFGARQMDPAGVLAAMAGSTSRSQGGSHIILDEIMTLRRPCVAVDLNAQDGSGAVRMALHMQSWGVGHSGKVYALLDDPLHVTILQNICEMVGVGNIVQCLCGPLPDSLSVLAAHLRGQAADLLLLHNAHGSRLLENFEAAAAQGIFDCGSAFLIEGVLRRGAPELLYGLMGHSRDILSMVELIDVHTELGRDWMLVGQLRNAQDVAISHRRSSASDFQDLSSLVAESDYLCHKLAKTPCSEEARERLCKRLEQLLNRTVAAFSRIGICPTRSVGVSSP